MAIDKKLQIFDDEGNPVDYDILASDVKFLPDGKDLPTKLAEMEVHQGDGTVTGVKVGSDTYEPTEGVVDLSTPFGGKVDKNGTDSLMSADEHTKLAGIEAGAEKNIIKGVKANGASTNLPVDQNGVVELPPAGSTISPATAAPSMDGNTAAVGVSDKYAREDHVHPHDSSKANSSDLQNYATKNELDQGLSGKQNTLTFDDEPTDGSDNPVKSGGVKAALDTKANSADVPTITQMSEAIDEAFNDAVVQTLDGETGVLDTLSSDSDTDALSANMGKVLKTAIVTMLGAMGNYCFPGGKPQLILDGSTTVDFSVRYSTSDLRVTYADGQGGTAPTTVELLGRLEIQLGTDNDLYVINESAVKVFVGGAEVANAYDPTTDKIIIPEVFGNVVIIAQAWTYVDRGLVLHLDGRNRGNVAGHWTSLVNYNNGGFNDKIDFTLTNCDETHEDYVGFDASENSKGVANISLLDVAAARGTVECAFSGIATGNSDSVIIIHNNLGSGNRIMFAVNPLSTPGSFRHIGICTSPVSTATNGGKLPISANQYGFFSAIKNSFKHNDVALEATTNDAAGAVSNLSKSDSKVSLFYRYTSESSTPELFFSGNLFSLRVYSVQLDDNERAQNYKIDSKRFNIS